MKQLIPLLMAIALTGCSSLRPGGKPDVVRINMRGRAFLNGKEMPVKSLSESFTKDEVIIESSRSTPYNAIAAVMEKTQEAGITKVSLRSFH